MMSIHNNILILRQAFHDRLTLVKKENLFRWWFFARVGYQTYFAFAMIGFNTLTVTFYLAIERAPFLAVIFPTFPIYVGIVAAIGLPILVLAGFTHYKKVPGFKSEARANIENNPYTYKLPPGWWLKVIMPYYLVSSKIMMKISQNEKISEDEKNELTRLQTEMEKLNKGEYVGVKGRLLPFGSNKDD